MDAKSLSFDLRNQQILLKINLKLVIKKFCEEHKRLSKNLNSQFHLDIRIKFKLILMTIHQVLIREYII